MKKLENAKSFKMSRAASFKRPTFRSTSKRENRRRLAIKASTYGEVDEGETGEFIPKVSFLHPALSPIKPFSFPPRVPSRHLTVRHVRLASGFCLGFCLAPPAWAQTDTRANGKVSVRSRFRCA